MRDLYIFILQVNPVTFGMPRVKAEVECNGFGWGHKPREGEKGPFRWRKPRNGVFFFGMRFLRVLKSRERRSVASSAKVTG